MSEDPQAYPAAPCPNCGSGPLYRRERVAASGSHGPDLLPGLGKWGVFGARFSVVVCGNCGLMRLFASADARAKLRDSEKWQHL